MATVVNNPSSDSSSNSFAWLIAALIILAAVFMFIYYGLPSMRQVIQVPVPSQSTPNVNIPDRIDVNINPNPGTQ